MTRKERKEFLLNYIHIEITQNLWEIIETEEIDKSNFWEERTLEKVKILKNMMIMDGSFYNSTQLMIDILHRF